jgi:hypothetical protein
MKLDEAIEVLEAYSQTRMNTELPIVEAIDTILEAVKPKVEEKLPKSYIVQYDNDSDVSQLCLVAFQPLNKGDVSS